MLHQRYVLLSFVLTAIVAGLTFQAASTSLVGALKVADLRMGPFATTTVVSTVGAAGIFFALIRNRAAIAFTDEVVDELTKVTWPSKDETVKASTTVVFTTLFTAALLGGYDYLWKNLADIFLFSEGGLAGMLTALGDLFVVVLGVVAAIGTLAVRIYWRSSSNS